MLLAARPLILRPVSDAIPTFSFTSPGEAPKVLSEQMEVAAGPPKCDARPGHREKRIGSMLCSTDGASYECFFAIDVQKQLIDGAIAC